MPFGNRRRIQLNEGWKKNGKVNGTNNTLDDGILFIQRYLTLMSYKIMTSSNVIVKGVKSNLYA